jgi:hypothetical protein
MSDEPKDSLEIEHTQKAGPTPPNFTMPLDPEVIKLTQEETEAEVKSILAQLENNYPGLLEGASITLGAAGGGTISLGALWGLGSVAGLSGAGITSGLAAAGALVGGGMVAGIGVLAAPIAGLALGGYWVANRFKRAQQATALAVAIGKLYDIQGRLLQHAEYFTDELVRIRATIELLRAGLEPPKPQKA